MNSGYLLDTYLSNPTVKISTSGNRALSLLSDRACSKSQLSSSSAFHDAGGDTPFELLLSSRARNLGGLSIFGDQVKNWCTYNSSISSAYKAKACFRITVPFAALGRGFDGLATMIVSLNSLENVGPRWFASSMTGLKRRSNIFSRPWYR